MKTVSVSVREEETRLNIPLIVYDMCNVTLRYLNILLWIIRFMYIEIMYSFDNDVTPSRIFVGMILHASAHIIFRIVDLIRFRN